MKCPICNKGNLKKGKSKYSELGIELGEYPSEICSYCGEIYFDTTVIKIQEKSKKTWFVLFGQKNIGWSFW